MTLAMLVGYTQDVHAGGQGHLRGRVPPRREHLHRSGAQPPPGPHRLPDIRQRRGRTALIPGTLFYYYYSGRGGGAAGSLLSSLSLLLMLEEEEEEE